MMRRLLKLAVPRPVRVLLNKMRIELRINVGHARGLYRARGFRNRRDLKLNLACGENARPGWVNIDFTPQADFALDLRKPFPFGDNSCSMIYCEHFLEHIEYPNEVEGFLRESFRVLDIGGNIRIGVPDTELAISAYIEGYESSLYRVIRERQWAPDWCKLPMEYLNLHFRHWGHCFAYDFEILESALKRCGFREIKRRPFDRAQDSEMRKDVTLYVEASKPAAPDLV